MIFQQRYSIGFLLLFSLWGAIGFGDDAILFSLINHRTGKKLELVGMSLDSIPMLSVIPILEEAQVPFTVEREGTQLHVGARGQQVGVFLVDVENCILDGRIFRCIPPPQIHGHAFLLPVSVITSLLDFSGAVPGQWKENAFHLGQITPPKDSVLPPAILDSQEIYHSPQMQGYQMKVVVIDPGHGGKDPGCISPSGLQEATVTLDVALRLKALLESDETLSLEKVVLTRERDVSVPLLDRAKLANSVKGDLFISLHTNASLSQFASGIETYFVSQTEDPSSLEVESRENAVMDLDIDKGSLQLPEGVSLDAILLDLQYMEFVRESQLLCGILQRNLCAVTGARDRGVRQALFYVLRGASMPSVLIELGFMSNVAEEKLLASSSYRQKLAFGIAQSITQYAKKLEIELGSDAENSHD